MASPKREPATVAVAAILVAAAALPAQAATDWTTFGFDNQRTGYNPREATLGPGNVGGLTQSWSTDIGGPILTQPTVALGVATGAGVRDLVYAGTLSGNFAALDRLTGEVVWTVHIPPLQSEGCGDYPNGTFSVISTPVLDRGRHTVFVAARDGDLHALDEATGAELAGWPVKFTPSGLRDTVIAGLTEVGSSIYAETAGACDRPPFRGEAVRIDATSHAILARWFPEGSTGPYGGGIWGPGGLSADPGGSALYAATGNAIGKNESAGFGEHVVRLTPALVPKAANYPGLKGFDVDFGATPLLYRAPGCPAQLAVMNKSGAFLVYDRAHIARGARQRIQMGAYLGDVGNFIGVPAYDPTRRLVLVNLTTDSSSGGYGHGLVALGVGGDCLLHLAWQQSLPGQATRAAEYPSVPPTVANGVAYVARSNDSVVYALDVASGAPLWNSGSQITGGVYAAVTVANGQLLVAGFDNRIHAFAP